MIGRALGAAAAAILLALQVVRSAVAAQYADAAPERAAKLWPSHPEVELSLALTQIGLATGQRRPPPQSAFDLVTDAAAKAPLAEQPFLVRGVQAQMAGDASKAHDAFLAARIRDPRSLPARYFLADHYARSGEAGAALREMGALARLVPDAVASFAPHVAAYAQDRRNWAQVKQVLGSDPQLREAVLGVLAADARNADLVLMFAGRAQPGAAWQPLLVNRLIEAGRYGKALQVWSAVSNVRRDAREPVFDADFRGSSAPPPFNWVLTSSALGLAEFRPPGTLHVLYYGQDSGALASQLLLLRPGRYRLAMQVSGDLARAAQLSWSVTCVPGKQRLLSMVLADARAARGGAEFEVPAACAAQQLELVGTAPDLPQQVDLSISAFRLEPAAPTQR